MLQLAQDPEADALLDRDPLALLIGMLLDQQFPMERAFQGPAKILDRFGVLDFATTIAPGLRGATEYSRVVGEKKEEHLLSLETDSGGFRPTGFNLGNPAGDAHLKAARARHGRQAVQTVLAEI